MAALGSTAARLLRAYTHRVETLRRLRHGGAQVIRIERADVNDGGQAIIGKRQDGFKGRKRMTSCKLPRIMPPVRDSGRT